MVGTSFLNYQNRVYIWIGLNLVFVSATFFQSFELTTFRIFTLFTILLNLCIAVIVKRNLGPQLLAYESNQATMLEQQLATIVRSTADAVIYIDLNGYIQTWNQSASILFGYSDSVINGKFFSILFGDGDAARLESEWLLHSLRSETILKRHETTCQDVDGYRYYVDMTANLMYGDDQMPCGISLILRDITYRRQHETEREQQHLRLKAQSTQHAQELSEKIVQLAEANSELKQLDQTRSEFISLVSHQIRAPLTNMVGAVQRMQSSCATATPTCHRMFVIFEQQVNRLDRLVQDVLNLSRLEQGDAFLQQEPISLGPTVRQAIQQIETRISTHTIHLMDKPGLPLVYADRDRIVEVLTNLLDNAHKYTPSGKPIYIDIRADQNEVTVSINDSGQGLPDADLERVFEKFYRVDSSDSQASYGYGLGLYLCRRLIEAQGGRIWAENHPDGGAVFSFALPTWEE